MPLLNNLFSGDDPAKRLKTLAITAAVILLIVVFIVGLATQKKTVNPTKNDYYDPGSGETVSNPEGKTPESYGESPDKPKSIIFLGFSRLLERSITSAQLEETKVLLQAYSNSNKLDYTELSINKDAISVRQPEIGTAETNTTVTAKMTINRGKVVDLKLSYPSIKKIQVAIIDNGKEVYNSGLVESSPPLD